MISPPGLGFLEFNLPNSVLASRPGAMKVLSYQIFTAVLIGDALTSRSPPCMMIAWQLQSVKAALFYFPRGLVCNTVINTCAS
jgi:hypothetical protein